MWPSWPRANGQGPEATRCILDRNRACGAWAWGGGGLRAQIWSKRKPSCPHGRGWAWTEGRPGTRSPRSLTRAGQGHQGPEVDSGARQGPPHAWGPAGCAPPSGLPWVCPGASPVAETPELFSRLRRARPRRGCNKADRVLEGPRCGKAGRCGSTMTRLGGVGSRVCAGPSPEPLPVIAEPDAPGCVCCLGNGFTGDLDRGTGQMTQDHWSSSLCLWLGKGCREPGLGTW